MFESVKKVSITIINIIIINDYLLVSQPHFIRCMNFLFSPRRDKISVLISLKAKLSKFH